jgi:thymidine phosphorylase
MGQCLGRTAGNALEVQEAIDLLTGRPADLRLREVTLELAAAALTLVGLAGTAGEARARAEQALASGAAAERFARMVAALGGPADLLERAAHHLPSAPITRPVSLPRGGHVAAIDARALGLAVVELGGGRQRPNDAVDAAVGLVEVVGIGEWTGPDRPFAVILARSEADAAIAAERIAAAVTLAESPPAARPSVIETLEHGAGSSRAQKP